MQISKRAFITLIAVFTGISFAFAGFKESKDEFFRKLKCDKGVAGHWKVARMSKSQSTQFSGENPHNETIKTVFETGLKTVIYSSDVEGDEPCVVTYTITGYQYEFEKDGSMKSTITEVDATKCGQTISESVPLSTETRGTWMFTKKLCGGKKSTRKEVDKMQLILFNNKIIYTAGDLNYVSTTEGNAEGAVWIVERISTTQMVLRQKETTTTAGETPTTTITESMIVLVKQ